MATGLPDKRVKLVPADDPVLCSPGDDVTIPCRLSPATSAVAMEIRWFRNTDCVYLYKNSHDAEGRGYEDRVGVTPQQLQRGDLSLRLRGVREEDGGWFLCQVIQEEHLQEARVGFLYPRGRGAVRPGLSDKLMMELSVMEEQMKNKDEELAEVQDKMKSTIKELDTKDRLLQQRDTELESMTKRDHAREALLDNLTSEVETSKRLLESLGKELQDRNSQLQELRTQLLQKERELEDRDGELFDDHNPNFVSTRKRNSMDVRPPHMGGESPGPAPPVSPAVCELRLVLLGGVQLGRGQQETPSWAQRSLGGRPAHTHSHTHPQRASTVRADRGRWLGDG
ncbi:hypothetical protein ACEWY4_022646 [Coilia grayii]|uniref:Ig-like domain-containing protein n=1 Tax=Coilia grayii TaxID=363190 RepID=A0ABD1J4B1_9TELE